MTPPGESGRRTMGEVLADAERLEAETRAAHAVPEARTHEYDMPAIVQAAELVNVIGAIQLCLAARGMATDAEVINIITRLVEPHPPHATATAPVKLLTDTLKAIREEHEGELAQ